MKRGFIFISAFLVMLFLTATIIGRQHPIRFQFYPVVHVMGMPENVRREAFEQEIHHLAVEYDSIVARRIVKPNKEEQLRFVYEVYGGGKLPSGFEEATREIAQNSDLANSYIIVEGKLTNHILENKLKELGCETRRMNAMSILGFLLLLVSKGAAFFVLFIFIMTYSALIFISRMEDLRLVGIRLISGEKSSVILLKTVVLEGREILLGIISVGIIGSLILHCYHLFQFKFLVLLWAGIAVYGGILLNISLIFGFIYWLNLKKVCLIEVIKGKLPLQYLLTVMFIGQLAALVFTVGATDRGLIFYQLFQEHQSAEQEWVQQSDFFNLEFSLTAFQKDKKERIRRDRMWYRVIKEAVEEKDALLVKHNLAKQIFKSNAFPGTEYLSDGNTIYVTPNYLDKQNIKLDEHLKEKLNDMQKGQYGLILPEHLERESAYYQKQYTEYMSFFGKKKSSEKGYLEEYTMNAIVGYYPRGDSLFLYNNTPLSLKQYVKEPIIVVITPQSTGETEESINFWVNSINAYLFFSGYEKTEFLLKKYETYLWISEIKNSQGKYYTLYYNIKNEIITTLFTGLLAVITSLLLFNSMNLLYFEQFRRDIFIKRVSGMRFWELHKNYLMLQSIVLLTGFCISLFLAKNIGINIAIFLLFELNAWITLLYQMRVENKTAVAVLKGK